jgi:hypothetical protein
MSKPYKFIEISPKVMGVEFKNHIHMALMFMRIQEYTEGPKPLRGVILPEGDTLIAYLKKRKKLYYKAGWAGFNINGSTILKVANQDNNTVWNKYENELLEKCAGKGKNYYVIAYTKGDKATKKHEKVHAAFYLSSEYRAKVQKIIGKNGTKTGKKFLKKLDYNFPKGKAGKYHLVDEINAYAMEEKTNSMRKELGLSKKSFKKLKNLYKEYV